MTMTTMTPSRFRILLVLLQLTLYLFTTTAPAVAAASSSVLTCMVTLQECLSQTVNGTQVDEHHVVCIPIIDGRQTETLYILNGLPSTFGHNHGHALEKGQLFITLIDAVIVEEHNIIHVMEQTSYEVIPSPKHPQTRQLAMTGDSTIAFVRVNMKDAQVTASVQEIKDAVMGNTLNMMTQMNDASFGKLRVKPAGLGVYSVNVDQNIGSYERGFNTHSDVRAAIIEQLNVATVADLADTVFFCIPPGTQDASWVAVAVFNHGIASFNDMWCTSLSANIHEFMHTIGLGHSHLQLDEDYWDLTCYMGASNGNADYPRKTLNAHKHWNLGWFTDRHASFDPTAANSGKPVVIEIAAITDYDKAAAHQPVVVEIGQKYYMQYNRVKGFNSENPQEQDRVVVIEDIGVGDSLRNGGVDATNAKLEIKNYLGISGRSLFVQYCDSRIASTASQPDVMLVSVGFDSTDCSAPPLLQQPPSPPVIISTPAPVSAPTRAPTKAPIKPPPTKQPTKAPTKAPSRSPVVPPSRAPLTMRPSPRPSRAPTSSSPTLSPVKPPPPVGRPSAAPISNRPPTLAPTFRKTASPVEPPPPVGRPSAAPISKPTLAPSVKPTKVPTTQRPSTSMPHQSPSVIPSAVPSQSQSPSKSPTPAPTVSPSTGPSATPSSAPSHVPSFNPSALPTQTPSVSAAPSLQPSTSSAPTETPSSTPTRMPSQTPSASPSVAPSRGPSVSPSVSAAPSAPPSQQPTLRPSPSPTVQPSSSPSFAPSPDPSQSPSYSPSTSPSKSPSPAPSAIPSASPSTASPSTSPSVTPTQQPSTRPSLAPTEKPSQRPTQSPSNSPSGLLSPSQSPTQNLRHGNGEGEDAEKSPPNQQEQFWWMIDFFHFSNRRGGSTIENFGDARQDEHATARDDEQ
jgi:Gametolysin peptidase M11